MSTATTDSFTYRRTWGQRIVARRTDKGLSQAELALQCSVTQQTISRVELGRVDAREWLKRAIAVALDTTPDALFGWGE